MSEERDWLTLDTMAAAEIALLTDLMAAAFDADAPATPDFDRHLLDCYHCSDFFLRFPHGCCEADHYTMHLAGEVAGGAVIWHFGAYDAVLGLYFVAPRYQQHGLGRRGWRLIEARHPEVRRWAVAAPRWSPATMRFYQRQCGFHPCGCSGAYLSLAKELPPAAFAPPAPW